MCLQLKFKMQLWSVVFWVERDEGGAYQTMRDAMQQGKAYINLADMQEDRI